MRAIATRQSGDADVLQATEMARPTPGAGQVLIQVAAAGVNRPDVLQRMGLYRPPEDASPLLGLEVAGTIVDGDLSGTDWQLGDTVCALVHGGGYAEYCVAEADQCLPVPKGWTLEQAASLPETCFTVWSNVFERGRLSAGEWLLVQGGSSGIGTTAIQIATALGHPVFATAGTAEKCQACVDLGAQRAINYREEDFADVIRELSDGRGVDVILDMVGGDYMERQIKSLADDGRLVLIGLLGGSKAEVPLAQILMRRLTVTGSTLRPRTKAYKAQLAADLLKHVWPLMEDGRFTPQIHARFALSDAADAHRMMESGSHIGKLVLVTESGR
ncbi:MAG: NAD(P)H-quinone oxidoreductase [Xanthomonadales bacterium]|nr:NAD(P)H-quinone oxidoreductase [Xanthomonadales bacterium]